MNKMREIRIEKLTLNIGAGRDENVLKKALKLLKNITNIDPVQTITKKRLAAWGLRPGLPIGAMITLRGEDVYPLVERLLAAKGKRVKSSWFDAHGNVSFGIHEYVDIPGVKYDTEIGILGLQASITLSRPGFRVKKRKIRKSSVGKHQQITKEDAVAFMKERFAVVMEE